MSWFVMIFAAHNKTGRLCLTEVDDIGHWKADFSHLAETESSANGSSSHKEKRGRSNSVTSNSSAAGEDANSEVVGPKHGDIVTCKVLSVSSSHQAELSMRPSRVVSQLPNTISWLLKSLNLIYCILILSIINIFCTPCVQNQSSKKKALAADPVPAAGSVVQGYVANTSAKGCFLRLSSSLTGRVLLKDLSDEFIHSPVAGICTIHRAPYLSRCCYLSLIIVFLALCV
jgi:hypothetical protein